MSSAYRNADRAVEIYAGLEVEDGKPYLPANGTEGDIFTGYWCDRCEHDQFPGGGESCRILMNSLIGNQPAEWVYVNNAPVCTAFDPREGE